MRSIRKVQQCGALHIGVKKFWQQTLMQGHLQRSSFNARIVQVSGILIVKCLIASKTLSSIMEITIFNDILSNPLKQNWNQFG